MKLEILHGNSVPDLLARARAELGPDAVLVSLRSVESPKGRLEALVARSAEDASFDEVYRESMRPAPAKEPSVAPRAAAPEPRPEPAALAPEPAPAPPARRRVAADTPPPPKKRARSAGPRVIAFVGPTGAGKTTSIAKLLHHPDFFPANEMAVLTLDTFRVGGAEQLETWARLARAPFHALLDPLQAVRVLRRLNRCDVVLVDTPGRGPNEREDEEAVLRTLRALEPDEVHLVIPVGISPALIWRWLEHGREYGATHVLPTKTDEFAGLDALRAMVDRAGLELRWTAGGQRVPDDIASAIRRAEPVPAAASTLQAAAF